MPQVRCSPRFCCRNYIGGLWFYIDLVSFIMWEDLFFFLNTKETSTIFKGVKAHPPSLPRSLARSLAPIVPPARTHGPPACTA